MPYIHQVEVVTFKGTMLKIGLFLLIVFLVVAMVKCA